MNTKELLAALREMLDDVTTPYLWSDASLVRKLDNAVREACIRARLLKDDEHSCPQLCRLNIVAAQPYVKYPSEILVVGHGQLASQNCKLWALTAESMERLHPEWRWSTQSPSTPEFMVMDLAQKTLRLWPTPSASDTLYLHAWRLPRACERLSVTNLERKPVIDIPAMEELCHWAAHEAYMVKDTETVDPKASADHLALFEQRFGPRPSLHEMARWADSPPRIRHAVMF